MAQYINKDALIVEIRKRKNLNVLNEGAFEEDIDILSFLDTLEVKEVVAEQKGICNGILNTIVGDTTWNIKIPLNKVGLKHGDKVKIFIIKEK